MGPMAGMGDIQGKEGQEMSSWLDRGGKRQGLLSQDKKLEFYPKFHQKPLKSFIQESDMI